MKNNIPCCFKKDNDIEPILNICQGAKVQISGKNYEPDWGLFNGAVGKVQEIVYLKDESPLDGTLSKFIIVEFPDYCGPHWIQDKQKWVPIPFVNIPCSYHSYTVYFVLLSLAYAITGHSFQGQSAGPEHAIPCIIILPGTLKMERLCPGLLYMFISHGTMIGTPEDRSSFAIFSQ
jgi:hypothetical protein